MNSFHKMIIVTLAVIISTCMVICLSAYSNGGIEQVQEIINNMLNLQLEDVRKIMIKVIDFNGTNFY